MQENQDEKTTLPAEDVNPAQAADESDDVLPPADKPHESKSYLVFYVIGLFCVALVLILLSYVTQVRSDRKLNEMSSQLSTQASAVEGANARVQVLQETVEEQNTTIAELKKTIAEQQAGEKASQERYEAVSTLLEAHELEKQGKLIEARAMADAMADRFGADRLDGAGQDDLLTDAQAAIYHDLAVLEPDAAQ